MSWKPILLSALRGFAWVLAPFAALAILGAIAGMRLVQRRSAQPRLVWGPMPLINNRYWSLALQRAGFESKTLMYPHFGSINKREDFDLYVYELIKWPVARPAFELLLSPYVAFLYALWRFDVFHMPFSGGFLQHTPLWRYEAAFFRLAGKRSVVMVFGGDAYLYSRIIDPCLRHGLLLNYPLLARHEAEVRERVEYWVRHADVAICGFLVDGIGRWDVIPFNHLTIDTAVWRPRERYVPADGRNGPVKVMHTPNHRGFKGTEFLLEAVRQLRDEGLAIELILVEKMPNEEVRRLMAEEADILAEQFIATGYAMSGLEGMASGLPVLANLENEAYTRLFRRYSYLNECPVLSTTPETLTHNLRALVTNPALRVELGQAGRRYVEKYHSDAAAQYMFGAIYDRVWHGRDVDLLNLFHPLKSAYAQEAPISPPLVENRLPAEPSRHEA